MYVRSRANLPSQTTLWMLFPPSFHSGCCACVRIHVLSQCFGCTQFLCTGAKPGISHWLAGDVIRPLLQWLAGISPGCFSWCGSCSARGTQLQFAVICLCRGVADVVIFKKNEGTSAPSFLNSFSSDCCLVL